MRDHIVVAEARSGGEPAVFDHSNACGQWGDVMVELVSHHALAPERLERLMRSRPGLHHLAYFTADRTREVDRLASAGAVHVMTGSSLGGSARFDFLAPGDPLGHLLECYEPIPPIVDLYRRIRAASVGWDGARPVRPFSELGPAAGDDTLRGAPSP